MANVVSPTSISLNLLLGQTSTVQHISIRLPPAGAVDKADVFLLFDDTGSFASVAPTLISEFPGVISALTAALPSVSFGFGVGRFEDFGGAEGSNDSFEFLNGRPFILNQPIIGTTTTGFSNAIDAALNRTAPGYGGDGPETLLEGLYQTATGAGFDGNNNIDLLESGNAGSASTQTNPGDSGDVPPFSSFQQDLANNVLSPAGSRGGAGFRPGALPIILAATDIGTVFEDDGFTAVTGVGAVTVPRADLTSDSRGTTPFHLGAKFQQTIDALKSLGALVIGLGTGSDPSFAPRNTLEGFAKLTGAVNGSTSSIDSGITGDPIAPGDPFYFMISPGSGPNIAAGVQAAIQAAITSVNLDINVVATDLTVGFHNLTGVRTNVPAGGTAAFDVTFKGDGHNHTLALQFVRNGTDTVLGTIPVKISALKNLRTAVFIPHPLTPFHSVGVIMGWVTITNTGPNITANLSVRFTIPGVVIRPLAASGAKIKSTSFGTGTASLILAGGLKKGATATIAVSFTVPSYMSIDFLRKNLAVSVF